MEEMGNGHRDFFKTAFSQLEEINNGFICNNPVFCSADISNGEEFHLGNFHSVYFSKLLYEAFILQGWFFFH